MKKIGFIGAGIMGSAMVRNLRKAGFDVQMYARHPEKVADLVKEGVPCFASIAECVDGCDAVFTIVGYPKDVEDVYYRDGGIFDSAKPGAVLIDSTTSSPSLAVELYEFGKAKGFKVLDAPVTGGQIGAINGTLSVLVGGDREVFDECVPIFEGIGTNITYQGKAGCGQHAKLMNQIMIAANLSGVCEAITYAKREGLDLETVLKAVSTGAAASMQLTSYSPKLLAGDYSPGFFMKHFIKDMKLAKDECDAIGLKLPVLEQVLSEALAVEEECAELGNHSLIKYYER